MNNNILPPEVINLYMTVDGVLTDYAIESAGVAAYSIYRDNECYLWVLSVKPLYRNLGIARKLLTEVCRIADNLHYDLTLDLAPRPDTDYTRLEKLYESFGFVHKSNNYLRFRRQ